MGIKKRHKVAIEKFQELLRSGNDHTVDAMCEEVGEVVYLKTRSVKAIINKYYRTVVTKEMIEYTDNLKVTMNKDVRQYEYREFAKKFNVCLRESILLIRYIRRRNE